MRHLFLNLLTLSLTLALLAVLALPASRVLHESRDAAPAAVAAPAPTPAAPDADRMFGVAVDPWHLDDWSNAVGATPDMLAKFQAFSSKRPIEPYMAEAERRGVRRLMISWEPWRPVPALRGREVQFRPQRGYRNSDIARGVQDRYITRFARSLAGFDGVVYLRYAHEMNGIWYPWTHEQRAYRQAWRRVVGLVRDAGARNVRFVWSVNPSLYETPAGWLRRVRRYWPGERYVDYLGATAIDFGGKKDYPVTRFEPRLRQLHQVFRKPLMITEANTEFTGRVQWLRDLRRLLDRAPWIKAVVWSQLPSRGRAQMQDVGVVDWDVQRDPPSAGVLRQIIHDGSGALGQR
jgi:hypothetical protein